MNESPETQWFTADLHFGHANIIDYCNRPFTSVSEMNDRLVENFNAVVSPDDDVWVLGDIAMGNIKHSLTYVSRLHGRLHLVAGNHDRPFRRSGESKPTWETAYLDAGFMSVHHGTIELEFGTAAVLACHFPYVGDSHQEDRFEHHRPKDVGSWLLHGHVHDRWLQQGRMVNVGVDAWAGRPVNAATLMDIINDAPTSRPPLPWQPMPR